METALVTVAPFVVDAKRADFETLHASPILGLGGQHGVAPRADYYFPAVLSTAFSMVVENASSPSSDVPFMFDLATQWGGALRRDAMTTAVNCALPIAGIPVPVPQAHAASTGSGKVFIDVFSPIFPAAANASGTVGGPVQNQGTVSLVRCHCAQVCRWVIPALLAVVVGRHVLPRALVERAWSHSDDY